MSNLKSENKFKAMDSGQSNIFLNFKVDSVGSINKGVYIKVDIKVPKYLERR